LWRNTAAITSIRLYPETASWLSGSTFTLYGIAASSTPKAAGGTITTDGTYWIHTFTGSGTFSSFVPIEDLEYLVVAGGGSGARGAGAGGGGAGGYRCSVAGEFSGANSSAESPLFLQIPTSYTVTVGAGGAGVSGGIYEWKAGNKGNNSVFHTVTSEGGGRGGERTTAEAGSGGSGGGGGPGSASSASGATNQGFAGGHMNGYSNGGAGGGGAGQAGTTASVNNNRGWNGGNGISSSITGSSVTRAGGGGGGCDNVSPTFQTINGTGGSGGGTSGVFTGTSIAANANTGGGSGGAGRDGSSGTLASSGNGGSGIVIVRYKA
jgi:hypothetical protein